MQSDSTHVVTVTGFGLDPTATTGSVKAVRFEASTTCTATTATVNNVVTIATANLSASADFTELYVSLAGVGGFASGSGPWAVCVHLVVPGVSTVNFQQVSSAQLVTVGERNLRLLVPLCFRVRSHSPFFCASVSAISFSPTVLLPNESTSLITISGVNLDSTPTSGSIRALRLEKASTCTSTLASGNSLIGVALASITTNVLKNEAVLSIAGGVNVGRWSVCLDWQLASGVVKYVSVSSTGQLLQIGEPTSRPEIAPLTLPLLNLSFLCFTQLPSRP